MNENALADRQAALANEPGGDAMDHNVLMEQEEVRPDDMWLSPLECSWAQELKETIEMEESGIEPLTDFEYAEHAIVAQGNLEEALRRIQGMQTFREVYRPKDTVQEGVYYMQAQIRLLPGVYMHTDISAETGTCMCVWNFAKFDPTRLLATEENWKTHILGEYFWRHMQQPTFRSVRQGSYQLIESRGVGWHNFDSTAEQRWNQELMNHMPMKVKQVLVYNSNTVMNLVWSLAKPFMMEEHRNSMKLGCTIDCENPEATLMDVFCQPSVEAAEARVVENANRYLAIRYQNQSRFRLPQ